MNRTRIAFIGAGTIAGYHLRSLLRFDDVEILAVADPYLDRASAIAAKCSGKAYDDYTRMLDNEILDAVYICIPPFAHGAPEAAIIERGLPFFVEKPLAVDLETAETVMREVTTRGLVTAVGYQWRYLDTVEWLQELISRDTPRLALGYWLDQAPANDWWIREAQSGGQMVEQSTHIFDLVRLLMGEVIKVYGAGSRFDRDAFPGADIFDVSTATLHFASGALATISSTCLLHRTYRVGLRLFCEGVAIEMSPGEITYDLGKGNESRRAQGNYLFNAFAREDRAFVDAVQGKPNRIRAPYQEAMKTHRLVIGAARSAREGCVLEFEPEVG